jgi:PAS domain S-box-containing protein
MYLLLFFLMTAGIIAGGFHYHRRIEKAIRSDVGSTLKSIANLKVDEIASWRKEKIAEATMLSRKAFYLRTLERWLDGNHDDEFRDGLQQKMDLARDVWDYHRISIIDMKGNLVIDSGDGGPLNLEGDTRRLRDNALRTGIIQFGEFYRCNNCQKVHIDIVAPIYSFREGHEKKALGALIMKVDPEEILYPLIQSWPVPSRSAEALLLMRQGNEVVFLNELRHVKALPLSMRLPLSRQDLPAAMAVLGHEGIFEGHDYRGTHVIASMKKIPGTKWYLISKVDYEEALAPFHQRSRQLFIMLAVLIACAGSVAYGLFAVRERGHYRQLFNLEAEKRAILKRFKYLVREAGDVILLMDVEDRITEFNEKALELFGYGADEMCSMKFGDLMEPVTGKQQAELPGVEAPDGLCEVMCRRRDGRTFHAEMNRKKLDIEGTTFTQAIIRDITERKRGEEALARSNKELEVFAYVASHDLQEPLRKIIAFSDRLRRQCGSSLDEQGEDSLRRMERAAQRMKSLIDGILLYSRVSSTTLPFKPVDLNATVREALSDLEVRIAETGARIEAGELPTVMGNPIQLGQLFMNLTSNALKFKKAGERPVITIQYARLPDRMAEITFRDNGIGFDEKYLDIIFKPFQRLNERSDYEGIGMGLTICQRIVTHHGGEISAESSPGNGAAFRVRLPARQE